ncbi:hypothetical protein HDN1F_07140 [gamma proteobacterium HdN1]|nr:hypothetical protein HDN1F_07140 [gamma proteobacterium HdN1]
MARTPRDAGIRAKKKGPENIQALQYGGGTRNRTRVRFPHPDSNALALSAWIRRFGRARDDFWLRPHVMKAPLCPLAMAACRKLRFVRY